MSERRRAPWGIWVLLMASMGTAVWLLSMQPPPPPEERIAMTAAAIIYIGLK